MKQKDYLDKVVDQLVNETPINGSIASTPFTINGSPRYILPFIGLYNPPTSFSETVTKVYGLTEEETEYVWRHYRSVINNKINPQFPDWLFTESINI